MGDSDEEQDKKRRDRDKFKRERECSERVEISDVKRRHPSLIANTDDKLKSRVEISPILRSNKRLKRESQDFQNFPFPWQSFEVKQHENVQLIPSIPPLEENEVNLFLMSFKQFMMEQDDSIDEGLAVNRYNEYKQNISAKFISSYFEEHKNEEWFQEKYHPVYYGKINDIKQASLLQRFFSFWYLFENRLFDNFSLDIENLSAIENIVDISVLLMEYDSITDRSIHVSDFHLKLLQQLSLIKEIYPDDIIKPDTTVISNSEDGEVNEDCVARNIFIPEKQYSLNQCKMGEAVHPYLTSTVCVGGLPLAIQKESLESICRPFGRVLRIFLTDPTFHSCCFRNSLITFSESVDFSNLSSQFQSKFSKEDLPDSELSICLEKDRIPKVKSCGGIFNALDVVLSDISLAVKLIENLDSSKSLFVDMISIHDKLDQFSKLPSLQILSSPGKNPLFQSVPSDSEISIMKKNLAAAEKAEEEEEGVIPSEVSFRRDNNIYKILDHLLLYLRIVHSYDYYSNSYLEFEDMMPSRLSQISVRGPTNNFATIKEVNQHISDVSNSISNFLVQTQPLTQNEMLLLGKRIEETSIESFIQANTKMIEAEKFLCPLSGKKFKGPEYVRKHIHNKHNDKIDEVKLEVQYFNRYLADKSRPMPEMKNTNDSKFHLMQRKPSEKHDSILGIMGKQALRSKDVTCHAQTWPFHPNMILPPHGPPFHHNMDFARFPAYSHFGNKRNVNRKIDDNRKPISYKDWDDPNLDN